MKGYSLPKCPKCLGASFSQFDEEPLGQCLECGETYFLGLPYIDISTLRGEQA
jgi:predicted  nucleic acid-binding Zn-ribbon protein